MRQSTHHNEKASCQCQWCRCQCQNQNREYRAPHRNNNHNNCGDNFIDYLWKQRKQSAMPLVSFSVIFIVVLVLPFGLCLETSQPEDKIQKNRGESFHNKNDSIIYLFACPESQVDSINNSLVDITINESTGQKHVRFGINRVEFEGCPGTSFVYTFDHKNDSSFLPHEQLVTLQTTGSFQLDKEYYSPSEFCIKQLNESVTQLNICKPTCGGKTPCLPKCCSMGKSLAYVDGKGCQKNEEGECGIQKKWKPKMFEDPYTPMSVSDWSKLEPHISHSPPKCTFTNGTPHTIHESWPSIVVPDFDSNDKIPIRLLKDGNMLRLSRERSWVIVPKGSFCIDDLIVSPEFRNHSNFKDGPPLLFIKCQNQEEELNELPEGGRLSIVYVVTMFVSALFLLMTAVVYIILWDKLCTSVHGWTILSYVISMFLLYIFLGISHTMGLIWNEHFRGNVVPPTLHTGCVIIGATVHFFFISTFAFLTLINLDLWLTFRSHTPVGERSKGVRRFVYYNLFAWGSSIVVVTVGFVLENIYPDIESEVIVPDYGKVSCLLAPWAMGYYVYSIIGALLAVNLIFIGLTVWTIYQFRRTTSMIPHRPHQSFKLFLKIFTVCGLTWVLEIVSWLSARHQTKLHWLFLDCVNILQAVGIFIIFICKKKTIKQLQQKLHNSCTDTSKCLCCNITQPRQRRSQSTENGRSTRVTGVTTTTKQSSFTS